MTQAFKDWLRAQDYSTHTGGHKRCKVHGYRESGVYSYRRSEYDCLHCLIAQYEQETGQPAREG